MSEEAISLEQFAGALAEAEEGQPQEEPETAEEAPEQAEGQPEAEAEAEDAEQSESDAEEKQEEQPQEGSSEDRVLKWTTAAGETYEVTEAELKSGYMREADYRQKTQTLAEERRQAEQTIQQKFEEVETFSAELAQLQNAQAQIKQFEELDWDALYEQDPTGATRLQGQYLRLKDKTRELAAEYETKRAEHYQERQKAFHQATREAVEHLQKAIPNFGAETLKSMREYGLKEGFTEQELAAMADKRQFMALWKAAQWDALQAKKPEVVNKVKALPPKSTKSGVSTPPPSAVEKAQKQFAAKRDVNSFARLLALQDK